MTNQNAGPQPVEIYISNLISGKAPVPENIKPVLEKLEAVEQKIGNLYQSINQARNSLKTMEQEQLKCFGSAESLINLIQEIAPKDEFDKYLKEVLNGENVNGNA